MAERILYALKVKTKMQFPCISNSAKDLKSKIDIYYWNVASAKEKGIPFTKKDFMKEYEIVKIKMNVIKMDLEV